VTAVYLQCLDSQLILCGCVQMVLETF
jgi:hypothetical protein